MSRPINASVNLTEGEMLFPMPIDRALRLFRKRCEQSGVIGEMKRQEHFVSYHQRRKLKSLRNRRRIKMAQIKWEKRRRQHRQRAGH